MSKLWIDTRGEPVVTRTPTGEKNARFWGWTEAVAIPLTDETHEKLAGVLKGQGLTDEPDKYDSSIHSWRCEHPDRYGKCSCFDDLIDAIIEALEGDKHVGQDHS